MEGECRQLDELDFEARDWVPDSGWPFGVDELRPWYERAQAACQLSTLTIVALALRLAQHLGDRLRSGDVASPKA